GAGVLLDRGGENGEAVEEHVGAGEGGRIDGQQQLPNPWGRSFIVEEGRCFEREVGSRERDGEDLDHKCERRALGAAERHERALQRSLGIRCWLAVLIERPTGWNGLALLRGHHDLAARDLAQRQIYDHRRLASLRRCKRDWIGAKDGTTTTPSSHGLRSVAKYKRDHALLRQPLDSATGDAKMMRARDASRRNATAACQLRQSGNGRIKCRIGEAVLG